MSVTAQRAAVGVLALLMATQAFGAVTFTVNSNADLIDKDIGDGVCLTDVNTCTLRAAVMQANVTAIDSTIQLPANTYTLVRPALGANGADQGDLNLAPPLSGSPTITIAGAGAATTIIDANGIDRVLSVESLRYAIISGVTVTHGVVSGRDGGGIYNSGILTLRDSIVSYNSVLQNRAGGGIYTTEAMTLTRVTLDHNQVNGNGGAISNNNYLGVYQSTLSNNMASDHGGGIYHDGGSLSTMVGSTLSNNTAGGNGGAIYNAASKSLSLDFCTVSGNHALGVHGGGIWSDSSSSLTLDHSTLSGNTAAFSGGAIEMYVGSQLALGNSTLSGNSAGYSGGGLFAYRAYASIVNTTIAFNSANNSGGGISSAGTISGGSTVNVSSSTIA